MSNKNISEITIDLDNVFDLNRYDESTMLQYAAKEQLEQLFNGFVKNLGKYGEDSSCHQRCDADKRLNDIPRSNNTIFINGQRGTGKTTFLRAMLDYYSNNDEGICPLAFIDPTLIETHQNILVDIVVKFKQLYDEKLKYCADEDINRQLNTCLEEMAEGLKLASHHKTNHDKHDDSWFLSQALKSAKSGQYLEERFHHFINAVAKALNKKLFIIAIDDVDTHTQKAYDVLETIRRYLNHPRVVVLISGDLRLYNHIVKNQKQLELQSIGKQDNDEKETRDLVSHLTQQYMTKIFPAYQRIDLKLLIELIRYSCEVKVKYKKEIIESIRLSSYVESIFSDVLKIKIEQVGFYRDFLLSQPIRSVVQIFKNLLEKKSSNTSLSDSLRLSLKSIFIGELVDQGIDHVLIEYSDIDMNKIANAVFDLCYRNGELETGFYLRPDSDKDAYNAAKVYLATIVSQLFEKKSLSNALRFMLTCGAAINTFMHYIDRPNDNRDILFKNYKDYVGLTRNENIMTLSAHLGAVIFSDYKGEKKIHAGLIRVNRKKINYSNFDQESFYSITGWEHSDVIGSLDKLSSMIDKKQREKNDYDYIDYVATVAVMASSYSVQIGSEKRDYISALHLIAMLSKLIDSDDFSALNFMTMNTYGHPNFINGIYSSTLNDDSDDDDDNDDDDIDLDKIHLIYLQQEIHVWRSNVKNKVSFSPILIGKVWERIQYGLGNISSNALSNHINTYSYDSEGIRIAKGDILLDDLIARMVWGIINSIVIEEVRFGFNVPTKLVEMFAMAKNVSSSKRELKKSMENLKNFFDENKNLNFNELLPLSHCFLTCPLLVPFILKMDCKTERFSIYLDDKLKGLTGGVAMVLYENHISYEIKSLLSNENLELYHKYEKLVDRKIIDNNIHYSFSKLLISGCFRKK
ncbi:P-loop NTPase fold protein [Dickeya zeae]|uniref:P-loop NTPase fold protein n=1 Tax=Dickeya zeae TaxID=204042 RepID=UPI001CF3BB94|nr:P-loop NTPase fold protein [Dickeya zeae]MCA6985167.1 KAP family NTPase [Dickeya zeae]